MSERESQLLDTLAGVVRILDAVKYSAGLRGTQLKRLEDARALIAKMRSGESTND